MSLRPALYSQRPLVFTLLILLSSGFIAISLLSYFATPASVRDSEILHSLYLNLAIGLVATVIALLLVCRIIRHYQQSLEALTTTDSLTGLANRRGFDLLAAQALLEARRDSRPLAAMLLDLDHFKTLNDSHGHLAGDAVLAGFARDLRQRLRDSDIICRWGGEEFIILLKDTPNGDAQQLAEKIRGQAEGRQYRFGGQSLKVTVSLGLTELHDEDGLDELISRADQALYRAKQGGRNRVCTDMPGIVTKSSVDA